MVAAFATAPLGVATGVPSASGAADGGRETYGANGTKNCTGRGTIAVTVTYQPFFGAQVAVKKSGPPSSPTWGKTIARDRSSDPTVTTRRVFVSPYSEGTWSWYSAGPASNGTAQCSASRQVTSADGARAAATVTKKLGNRSCTGGKKAVIFADSAGSITVSWKSTANSTSRKTIRLPAGDVVNDVNTGEAAIYDARASTNAESFRLRGRSASDSSRLTS